MNSDKQAEWAQSVSGMKTMERPAKYPKFWSSDRSKWNFGDALSVLVFNDLLVDFFPYKTRPWTIGSVLMEGAASILQDRDNEWLPSFLEGVDCQAVFWACGLRGSGTVSTEFLEHSAVLAVRGPLSASELRGGFDIPLGDPGFFLPALYEPTPIASLIGKTVCVPHFHDARSDAEVIAATGCDVVLRTLIDPSLAAVHRFIDSICSASFVLSGAMHAAIVAMAYGKPFGYWESDAIDVPFKWADLSSLVGIPCEFQGDIKSAQRHYAQVAAKQILLPSLWPLVCTAPAFVRPSGLLKVLRYEIRQRKEDPHVLLDSFILEMERRSHVFDRLVDLSKDTADRLLPDLAEAAQVNERVAVELRAQLGALSVEQTELKTRLAEKAGELESARTKAAATSQRLASEREALEGRLAEEVAKLELARAEAAEAARGFDSAQADLETRMASKVGELESARTDAFALSQLAETAQSALEAQLAESRRELDAALTEAEATSQRLASEREALEARLTEEAAELELKRSEATEVFEARLSESRREVDAARVDAAKASQRFESARAALEGRLDEVEAELASVRSEKVTAAQRFDSAQAVLEARLEAKAGELEAALTDAALAARRFDDAHAAFEVRLAEKTDELDAARSDAAAAAEQYDSTQATFEVSLAEKKSALRSSRAEAVAAAYQFASERSTLEARLAWESGELGIARAETIAIARRFDANVQQVSQIVGQARSQGWAALAARLPRIRKYNQALYRQGAKIAAFLSRFSDAQLGMSSEGRDERILAYLLTLTPRIPDFPLLDRQLYSSMYPDVAATGMDPFIHYLDYGASEGRSPHPLLDHAFYTRTYPEVGRFPQSSLEHYIRFGTAKGYDPCELFCTADYFANYRDVKQSSLNPLIHYMRYPGCRPHRDFDSYGYMVRNPDVVQAGVNPLAHYLVWGKIEGRTFSRAHSSPAQMTVTDTVQPESNAEVTAVREKPSPAEPAKAPPIILMLDAFYPQPDKDSGSLDQVNYARIFTALGYEVAFASLIDFAPEERLMQPLSELGVRCVTGRDQLNVEEFVFLNSERITAFFLSRFNFGGAWIEKARRFCPRAEVIFNTVDLHHVREERQARLAGNEDAVLQADHTRRQELSCIAAADVTIVVSEVERTLLEDLAPSADVRVIPLIREVRKRTWPGFEERRGIVFVGGFQHQPNVDAVQFFLADVWPKVLAADPSMTFQVIGSNMPESLSTRTDPNVEWVGYVPELEPWLDKARATVAPLRYGAGAKGKVVSSLLNGVPCVASPIAAEGMGLTGGAGILVAETPDEFARQLLFITRQPKLWRETSRLGFNAVAQAYSLDRGIELMLQIIPRAMAD